jgi:hypothetical protein
MSARSWWRSAATAIAITAFGAWGLADRWLWDGLPDAPRPGWATRTVRLARAVAGAVTASLAAVLLLELFLRALGAPPGH